MGFACFPNWLFLREEETISQIIYSCIAAISCAIFSRVKKGGKSLLLRQKIVTAVKNADFFARCRCSASVLASQGR